MFELHSLLCDEALKVIFGHILTILWFIIVINIPHASWSGLSCGFKVQDYGHCILFFLDICPIGASSSHPLHN